MQILIQFLKHVGVGQVLGPGKSAREQNLKICAEEQERKSIRERGRHHHHNHDNHPHHHNHHELDDHHDPEDWTY